MSAAALDTHTKVLLTVVSKPLNPSADLDAIGTYVEGLWAGSTPAKGLEDLVERTICIEQIENFAALVPGANADHLRNVVAMIEVMEA